MRITIVDPADPRIEAYRDIRERDLRGRDGLAIAEGTVVLRSLVQSRDFTVTSVLVLRNRVDGIEGLLGLLPDAVPIYVAERAVMDAVAGFPIHRGVLAVARRTAHPDPLASRPNRVVVGIGLANHDNVGGIIRCAAAFGASVLLDDSCADPLYRKAIRVSTGSAFTVPHRRGGTATALLDALAAGGMATVALSPRADADIRTVNRDRRVALVVGAEGTGLPDAVLERCETARIAMSPGPDSLNVTVATGIALHALS